MLALGALHGLPEEPLGQLQLALIARALAPRPKLLLLDEPRTGIDHLAQQRFIESLGRLKREMNLTVVLFPALSRMQSEAERDGASGVVGVRFAVHNYVWGIHTLEFYVDGTAIRKHAETEPIRPTYMLPML